MPKLSVITVVLNNVKSLENTLKSVAIQTYKDLEYIVIDGGSTDGTLELLEKYKNIIMYIESSRDKGIYDAMNKGIKIAKGELIYFLGSDDVLSDSTCLSDVMATYKKNEDDLIYGNVLIKNKKGVFKEKGRTIFDFDIKAGRMPSHQAMFMKKERLIEAGLFKSENYEIAGDFEILCYFQKNNLKRRYINRTISICGNEGVSSISKKKLYSEMSQIIKTYYGSIRSFLFVFKKEFRR